MTRFWKKLFRPSPARKSSPWARLAIEALEERALLSGTPALTVSISPASFAENAGAAAATGTVTRVNTDNALALTVKLASSNTSQASVPASVVIPAGQASATFGIDAVDDHVVTGDQAVTITASADAAVPLAADTTFGGSGSVSQNSVSEAVAVQSDGKVVTAGLSYTGGTSNFYDAAVSRYNSNGTLDTSFGTNGTVITDISGQSDKPEAVVIQSDGKIVIGGIGGDGPHFFFELARYNTGGTLDSTFGSGGKVVFNQTGYYNEIWALALQSDGKILATGDTNGDYAVTRLNTDGSLDTTFGTNGMVTVAPGGAGGRAFGVVVQSDGKIVLAGGINGGNYYSQVALVRLTSSGALDSTFGTNGAVETNLTGSYEQASGVALQSDGKLVVSGYVSPAGVFPPVYDFALLRYNTDGTLDSTFGSGGIVTTDLGASDQALGVAVQSDGMILVSGVTNTSLATSTAKSVLARYLPDGTLDGKLISSTSFTVGQGLALGSGGRAFVTGLSGNFGGHLDAFQSLVSLSGSATVTVLETDNTPPVADAGPDQTVDEGATVTFDGSGSSDADGDTLTYSWDFGDNAQGTGVAPTHVYADDGVYTVKLTVDDGHGFQASSTMKVTVREVPPTAGVSGPADGVRGQERTFTFTATDPSSIDQASSFGYAIDWGDGNTDNVTGPASLSLSHVFTAGGTYQVTVKATDKDGGTSVSAASASITIKAAELQGSSLFVGGTTGADTILIKPTDALGDLNVNINGVDEGTYRPTDQLIVYTQAGNDTVRLKGLKEHDRSILVGVQALLFAGGGNDVLDARGSAANNALVGGAGNDVLYGGKGQDLLIGGGGADKLVAGKGGDILIGGSTDFDANATALTAILAEWGRTDLSYQGRIAHLMGTTSGGLNGSYLLNTTTVHDDAAVDQLYGGAGMDWFLYHSGGTSADVLHDRKHNETATPI
jgi:uncharacterized delta-60 repeat protein